MNPQRQVSLPFDFPFYGELKRTVQVCSNGYLTFQSGGSSSSGTTRPSRRSLGT
ncbi:MAG: hypothetical protein ACOX46_03510 [Limnochordia bacterium]